MPALFVKVPMM